MQNISFLAIVAVLLGCAFFFSQQTKIEDQNPGQEIAVEDAPTSLADVQACSIDIEEEESLACLLEAAATSEDLVDLMVDQILAEETDAERRISFRKVQFAWEDSRDAECGFVREISPEKKLGKFEEAICLRDRNLERYEQLEVYLCEWYSEGNCSDDLAADD